MSPQPVVVHSDEIEFYTDLALNESQRWIEAVTRERFFDEDDFLYSLRHGTQLRKILNIIRPGSIPLVVKCTYRPSCSQHSCSDSENESADDEDKTEVVVTVYELAVLCETSPNYVGPKIDKTALEPLINYHNRIVEEEVGGYSSQQDNIQLNSSAFIRKGIKNGLRFKTGNSCIKHIRKDVKSVLDDILDQVCFQQQKSGRRPSSFIAEQESAEAKEKAELAADVVKEGSFSRPVESHVSVPNSSNDFEEKKVAAGNSLQPKQDIICRTQIPYRQKVQDYLRQNDFEVAAMSLTADTSATYAFSDYYPRSPMSPSNDSVFSPSSTDVSYRDQSSRDRHHQEDMVIATRNLIKYPSTSAEDKLRLVASRSKMHEEAAEVMEKMKTQHLSREQLQKGEDNQDWKDDFDTWAKRREKKSAAALRRKSERESIEQEWSNRGTTGFFNKSGGGRSLHDVRLMDYGSRDDDYNNKVESPSNVVASPMASVHPSHSVSPQQEKSFDDFHTRGSSNNSTTATPYVARPDSLDTARNRVVVGGLNRSQEQPLQSTPIHSGLSSLDNTAFSLSPQRIEPQVETIRETKTYYEKQTTFVKSPNSPSTAPFTVLTASSKEENTNNTQTLIMDRDRITRLKADMEGGDSGVELNHPSPSPPLDSLSPNSQYSTDGSSKVGKLSPTQQPVYAERIQPKSSVTSNGFSNSDSSYSSKMKQNDRPYDHLTISIRQRPNSESGFGFSVKGGRDKREPIVIHTVLVNSSADKSNLLINDEVLEINGERVDDHTLASANLLIREAVRIGHIELLIRRYHPKQTLQTNKPPVSPRVNRKQSSFDETREKFEKPPQHTVPPPKSSGSPTSRGSHNPSYNRPKADSPPELTSSNKSSSQSPYMNRRRNPGPIQNFVPDVDRVPQDTNNGSEYRVTSVHSRQTPGNILDFIPDSERPPSSASSRSMYDEDSNYDRWIKEKRIIENNKGRFDQQQRQQPSAGAHYHPPPVSRVHYDVPDMRSDFGHSHSKSDSIDSALSSDHEYTAPNYNDKSVAAAKIGQAINNTRTPQAPKIAYETTVMTPTPVVQISSLSYQNGNLTDQKVTYNSNNNINNNNNNNNKSTFNEQNTPVQNYGLETIAFLAAKFRRINSTRRLQNRLKDARLKYYGINQSVPDETNEKFEDYFELNPYLRRVHDYHLYNLASRLISTSGTDLYFDGPKRFTYDIQQQQQQQYSKKLRKWSELNADFVNGSERSVVVVALRNRNQSMKETERPNVDSSGGVRLAPRPFGHVKHEPVAFSFEPVPGGGASIPVLERSPPAPPLPTVSAPPPPISDISPDSRERAMDEIRTVFGQRPVNGSDAEMKYLELAASENGNRPSAKSTPLSGLTNINDHWLVKDTEILRLSDQLKATTERSSVNGNYYDSYERSQQHSQQSQVGNIPPRYESYSGGGRNSRETFGQTGNGVQRYGDASVDYDMDRDVTFGNHRRSARLIDDYDDYSDQLHRAPSPKFPSNSVLHSRYGLPLDPLEDDNRTATVSDRQICAHCNAELGRGAAMTIESLGLYYHLDCFKCYVCRTPLGDGVHGTDVRVKDRKLNCQSCYVNDQTGEVYTEL